MPINLSGSSESPGKVVLTSANAAYEATDIKEDKHRDEVTDQSEQEPEYVNVVQDNEDSDTVDGDEKKVSADNVHVVQPENNSELKNNNNTDETNSNADSGSEVKPRAAGLRMDFDDEDHDLY